MTDTQVSLTLTTDELLAILQVMGASSMNGLGEPLAGLSEREQAARLNAGAETLLNRGLCRIDGDQLVIDDMLLAFVGASVIPDATLLISAVQPDQSSEPVYFHATPYISVEHQSPRPGVHVFQHLPDANTLVNRIETRLAVVATDRTRNARAEKWTIPDASLNTVLVSLRNGNSAEARSILSHHGWAGAALDALLNDLATAPSWVGMVGWGLREAEPTGGASAILYSGNDRYWLFTPLPDQPELLAVTQPDGVAAATAFTRLSEPLQTSAAQN
jgi:hypothetical protein